MTSWFSQLRVETLVLPLLKICSAAESERFKPGRNDAWQAGGRNGVAVITRRHGELPDSGSVDGRLRSLTP